MAGKGQDLRKPPRRSSIIAQQIANDDGVVLSSVGGFLRGLPPLSSAIQADVARNSYGRRSSNINLSSQTSVNGTPLNSGARNMYDQQSSIPRPVQGSSRKTTGKLGSLTRTTSVTSLYSAGALPPLPPKSTAQSGKKFVQKSNLRRSISMESFRDSAMTPGVFTPNYRSPDNRLRGCDGGKPTGSQSLKAPDPTASNYKKSMNAMYICVTNSLQKFNYHKKFTLQEFASMPSSVYMDVCKDVGTMMMGTSYFETKKENRRDQQDELAETILKLATLLQYPGTIKKSHIKTTNTPHSWPFALTFLCWLCGRVECALNPNLFSKPINDLTGDNFAELIVESCRVFFSSYIEHGQVDNALLEEELLSFRFKIEERCSTEIPKTKEELIADRDAEFEKLRNLSSVPDPTKGLMVMHQTYVNDIEKLSDQMEQSKLAWATYKNLSAIKATENTLEMQIRTLKDEGMELKNVLKTQPISKQRETEMNAEIEAMQKEINAVEPIIGRLQIQLSGNEIQKENSEKKFYDVISKLNCVEQFGAMVQKLGLNIPNVPQNPFQPSQFKDWVKIVEEIQCTAEKVISAFKFKIRQDVQTNEQALNRCKQAYRTSQDELANSESVLGQKKSVAEKGMEQLQLEMTGLVGLIAERQESLQKVLKSVQIETKMNEDLKNELKDAQDLHKKLEQEAKEWSNAEEDVGTAIYELEVSLRKSIYDMYMHVYTALRQMHLDYGLSGDLFPELEAIMKNHNFSIPQPPE